MRALPASAKAHRRRFGGEKVEAAARNGTPWAERKLSGVEAALADKRQGPLRDGSGPVDVS